MNEELKQWIQESKPDIKSTKEKSKKTKKKLKGKCQICGEKKAEHICLKFLHLLRF